MKKTIITILGCVILLILIMLSVFYFRRPSSTSNQGKEYSESMKEFEKNLSVIGQEGEPDEASKTFAKKIGSDAKSVVSLGNPVTSTKFLITAISCEIGKEFPGYAVPEGEDLTDFGTLMDENGNITNEYSYVVVETEVENVSGEKVEDDYIWGTFRLRFINPPSSYSTTGECRYLGEENPRPHTKDYYAEDFEIGEIKKVALIFIVPDGILENDGMYLEVNPLGAVIDNKDYDIRRYLLLN